MKLTYKSINSSCMIAVLAAGTLQAQTPTVYVAAEEGNPALMAPAYPVPYGPMSVEEITDVLNRVHAYIDANTPYRVVDRQKGEAITDFSQINTNAVIEQGRLPVISYEWGVTYSGMLLAHEVTEDPRFRDYVGNRLQFIVEQTPYFRRLEEAGVTGRANAFRSVLNPGALDDAGSMCAAMIKAQDAGLIEARQLIDHYADYITSKQYRLTDGTLARKRPLLDSVWLDDLYMAVPALAQMGNLTGDEKYFDDAVKQVTQVSNRLFNEDPGLYMHGWIGGMEVHPEFRWARANGWGLLAKTELLEVLPEDHAGYPAILALYRAHVRGLQAVQGHNGLWHQLLDHNDSYLETSASAIYTYCMARGINRGWLDPLAFGPTVQLAWNAVSTRVNEQGQVEGTCVGTGMGFDPAFYYNRPQSVDAAHGYGPVLLAGAEMLKIAKAQLAVINDGAVMFGHQPQNMDSAR